MHFKIGVTCAINAPAGSPFPLINPDIYQTVDYLSDHGFDSIELHLCRPDEVDAYRILDYCQRKGIIISSIGTGMAYGREGLSITSRDQDIRKRAVQRLKDQLDLASILGCSIVIGSMRGIIPPDESRDSIDRLMFDSCRELCDYAERGNGRIVIEAIDRIETNYMRTAQDVLDFIDSVGSNKLLVHLDTYHMNMEERSWREPVIACGSKLGHVHVADNTRHYPGYGLIDFIPFLKALEEIGYNQTLTLECYPWPDGKTAVERGLAHLRSLEAQL